jgi:peptidoglycan/LPS O-acetylase OafA/YrhL
MIKSDINRVMWSMTVECVATPLILLSVWLFHKHGERPLWILVAVLLSLSPVGQYSHLLGGYHPLNFGFDPDNNAGRLLVMALR